MSETEIANTEVLIDRRSVIRRVVEVFSNARSGVDVLTETLGPTRRAQSDEEYTKVVRSAYFDVKRRGGRLRLVTKIDEKNIEYCKQLMGTIEIRHLDDVKGNFVLSETEYLSSPGTTGFDPSSTVPVIYSNARPLIEQNRGLFERSWNRADTAQQRIKYLEEGTPQPKIEILRDPLRIRDTYLAMIEAAKKEVLVVIPTRNAFLQQQSFGVLDALERVAVEKQVKVSIVAPTLEVAETLETMSSRVEAMVGMKPLSHRRILEATAPSTVTILVTDRVASLIIEQRDDASPKFEDAIGVATYATRDSTVLANVRFFERVWEDTEVREREEALLEHERYSRKAAELLQDILSHDIRNYNQITKSNAELLKEKGLSESERTALVNTIIRAVDGSSELIERAKKLGRIVSQEEIAIKPVELDESLRRSVALVTKAYPSKVVVASFQVPVDARVLADDLLDEVFVNVISNAVNYTDGEEVQIEVCAAGVQVEGRQDHFWKVAITDHGRGIPDGLKEKVFTRYYGTSSGAGLGMSIVYALVVDRYSGRVKVSDRVEGDFKKGTRVEIWLPRP